MTDDNNKPTELDIELSKEVAEGVYANLAVISHSASEFVLDFARVMPGMPKAQVKSRIILTPEHTKRLLMSLQENVARYESMVGRIELHMPDTPTLSGFGGLES